MPRSIQEIIEHADELADRFEALDPDEGTEIPVEEYLLQRAARARAAGERQVLDAVARAQATEVPVEEYLLQRAARARAASEQQVIDAVARARAAGIPWRRIGELLGTSAQAAQKRYRPMIEAAS